MSRGITNFKNNEQNGRLGNDEMSEVFNKPGIDLYIKNAKTEEKKQININGGIKTKPMAYLAACAFVDFINKNPAPEVYDAIFEETDDDDIALRTAQFAMEDFYEFGPVIPKNFIDPARRAFAGMFLDHPDKTFVCSTNYEAPEIIREIVYNLCGRVGATPAKSKFVASQSGVYICKYCGTIKSEQRFGQLLRRYGLCAQR